MNDQLATGVAACWMIMGAVTCWFFDREINRGRTAAARTRRLLVETPVPYWFLIFSVVIIWPVVLWRLHWGYPEDRESK